jgi:DNA topoisomerase III
MLVRLFLCEKPSQGRDIARVLGAHERHQGFYAGRDLIVTWCIGHLLEAATPESYDDQYRRWTIEDLPIIPERWKVEVKAATAGQYKIVQELLQDATDVVIATDADREGEMIAREILDACGYRGRIQRLWLSALNDASIRRALETLRPESETLPLYHAALARARADWLIGMNLSRLFTILGRRAGHDGVLSVGRVQTPTLQLVVHRDREISNFISEPYGAIDVDMVIRDRLFTAHWMPPETATDSAGRCREQRVAHEAAARLGSAREALVESVYTERVREPPPLPFDLSTLQEVCSRQLGLDVQETLNIAQSLYETHKATTYPRSDSRYLPESMFIEVAQVLDALLATDPSLKSLLLTLDRRQRSRAWDDSKVSAHHGIIPTLEPTNLATMSEIERSVYRLIRGHYLAQFLPHHEYDRTHALLTCSHLQLQAKGKQEKVHGWRSVLDWLNSEGDGGQEFTQVLPPLTQGNACSIAGVELKSLKTLPPKHYTQGELIKAMKGIGRLVSDPRLKQKLKETTGIGTEATRAGIIQGLIGRGYLVKQRQSLRASPSAFILIDAVPTAVADPATTAMWEQALDLIAERGMSLETFVSKQSAWVAQLVRAYAKASLPRIAPSSVCTRTSRRTTKSRLSDNVRTPHAHAPSARCARSLLTKPVTRT